MKNHPLKQCLPEIITNVSDHFTLGDGKDSFWSNKAWTMKLFSDLAEKAKELGYGVCSGSVDKSQFEYGEWLYDHCWIQWDKNAESARLKDVILVLECEWDKSHKVILNDFEKLLVARANFRVMIFQQSDEKKVREVFGKLHSTVKGFLKSTKADEYLFCGYDLKTRQFHYHHYIATDIKPKG